MYELTQEQKDAIDKIVKAFQIIAEAIKKMFNRIKDLRNELSRRFNLYISSLHPKKRYKFLKSLGIRNYLPPHFRRNGVIHCRNNC